MSYDVTVMGAGPVGITTACTMKALNPKLKICVLDIRSSAARDYGVFVASDSVKKIDEVFKKAITTLSDEKKANELKQIYHKWKNDFVDISKIEGDLKVFARGMEIKVLRRDEYARYLTPPYLKELVNSKASIRTEEEVDEILFNHRKEKLIEREKAKKNPQIDMDKIEQKVRHSIEEDKKKIPVNENPSDPDTLAPPHKQLKEILSQTKIIVAADGAQSPTVKAFMGGKREKEKTYQHVIQLKFKTKGETKKQRIFERSIEHKQTGMFMDEHISSKAVDGFKPATKLFFNKDQKIFDALHRLDKPLSLDELRELVEKDPSNKPLAELLENIETYKKKIESRGGVMDKSKISPLPLTVYEIETCVALTEDGRTVVAVGDAESGLIIRRGFNKGLIQAAMLAEAIVAYFKANLDYAGIPPQFDLYQKACKQLVANEIWWIELKNSFLVAFQLLISLVHQVFKKWMNNESSFSFSDYSETLEHLTPYKGREILIET